MKVAIKHGQYTPRLPSMQSESEKLSLSTPPSPSCEDVSRRRSRRPSAPLSLTNSDPDSAATVADDDVDSCADKKVPPAPDPLPQGSEAQVMTFLDSAVVTLSPASEADSVDDHDKGDDAEKARLG